MINILTRTLPISATALAGVLFFAIASPAMASSDCRNFKGCERKICEIERQLTIAIEKGNERKASGLSKSLRNVKAHCTATGLEQDLAEEIAESREEIAEYQADLKEAQENGKADKVRKYQAKIKEEQNKIKRLEAELLELN